MFLNLRKLALAVPALVFVTIAGLPTKAHGIPYFARKYKTTCSRCHSAVPKLNTFGKNFQLHGYQQPGDKSVNKITFPEDKNLTLIDELPVAFLVESQVQLDKTVGNSNANNLSSPTAFHIFAADTIAPDIGFFGELATEDGVTDVGKASLIFSDLGNRNIFGQVGKLDLFEHGITEHDIFGRSGFAIQDMGLAATGSPFIPSEEHTGIRIYGLLGATVTPDLIHGKASGGEPAAPEKSGLAPSRNLLAMVQGKGAGDEEAEAPDPMDRQTGFLWEVGMFNSTNASSNPINPNPSDFEARANMYFSGDSFIGISGYSGLMTVGGGVTNRFRYAGPDFSYYFGKPFEKSKGMYIKPYNLFGGYLVGQADNPNDDGIRAAWNGFFVEQDVALTSRSMCFLRYDKVNGSHLGALMPTFTDALTANYTYYLRTNLWFGVEYTQDMTSAKQNLLGVVFNFAF